MILFYLIQSFECQRCDAVFSTLNALCTHKLKVHEKQPITSTKQTPKRVAKPLVRGKEKVQQPLSRIYINSDITEAEHVCLVCNTTFYSAKSLK